MVLHDPDIAISAASRSRSVEGERRSVGASAWPTLGETCSPDGVGHRTTGAHQAGWPDVERGRLTAREHALLIGSRASG